MSSKTISVVLIVLGIIILIGSLAADPFGLGKVAGFGWKQIAGAVVGIILGLVGYWLSRRKTS